MKEVELRRKIYEIKERKKNAMTNRKVVYSTESFLSDLGTYRTIIILYSLMGLSLL
jgi:hypothetical protein